MALRFPSRVSLGGVVARFCHSSFTGCLLKISTRLCGAYAPVVEVGHARCFNVVGIEAAFTVSRGVRQ